MKVLQVIGSMSAVRGGTSTAMHIIASALSGQGITTDIATTNDNGPGNKLDVAVGSFNETEHARVIYFNKQSEFYSSSLPMLRWLTNNARHYDLIHAHGLFNFAPGAAALAAGMSRRPYVLTPHGTLHTWGLHQRRPLLKKLSIKLLESQIVSRSSLLHFTSELEQSEARDAGFTAASTVVPLGIDMHAADSASFADDSLSKLIDGRPSILFLSRIDQKKGLDILIRAVAVLKNRLPEVQLLVAGSGEESYISSLKKITSELLLEQQVRWLGFTEGTRKDWLFNHCNLFALASHSENFGLAPVEAMAHGLPVIITPGVGLAPLVTRYGAGAVCDADPEQLAETLHEWLIDADRRQRAGMAGKTIVRDELSLPVFGQRLAQIYSQAIASHRTRSN